MAKCEAILLDHTNLGGLIRGIRMSRNSIDKSDSYGWEVLGETIVYLGKKDKELIEKCLQNDEGSVFEHLVYQWHLKFPRSVLQELSRHRVGISPTVKSTRYTLQELKGTTDKNISDFYYSPDRRIRHVEETLNTMRGFIDSENMSNDVVKTLLPEGFMSEGIYTMNARAMNHLFRLRNRPKVYQPFRELVQEMFKQIPEQHKFIFSGSFNETEESSSN